jgi:hypothetical protein
MSSTTRNSSSTSKRKKNSGDATFAAKLAVFMLNAQSHDIHFSEKEGFLHSSDYVKGIIPLLHMNISREGFQVVMCTTKGNLSIALAQLCSSKNIEDILSFEKFSCLRQCAFTSDVLVDRFVDTIETSYETRKNGIKLVKQLAKHQRWQVSAGIIPESSIAWSENL